MSEASKLAAEKFGEKLLESAKERLGKRWEDFDEEAQSDIQAAILDLADLLTRASLGENVQQEMYETRATISNWSFVAASHARLAIREIIVEGARLVGSLAAAFAAGLVA